MIGLVPMNLLLLFFLNLNLSLAAPPPSVRLEIAAATTGYNYFRIPNENANTRFDLPTGAWQPIYRAYATIPVSEKWVLRFLYAPLELSYAYSSASPSIFNNTTFAANTPLTARYKFNSYRASIIRYFEDSPLFNWHLGFSAKIRDAFITVSDSTTVLRKDDLGFVPLLNVGFDWKLLEKLVLSFDLDGLAGGAGRAFDGKLEVQYLAFEKMHFGLGYRFVEGGASVTATNNFALFHSVFLSTVYNF